MRTLPFSTPLVLLLLSCSTAPKLPAGVTLAELRTREGVAALDEGRLDDAIEALDEAVEAAPRALPAIRARIEAHAKRGTLFAVRETLEERARERPDDAVAHYAVGLARFATGPQELEPALTALRRAIELSPKEAEFSLRLGAALLEAERFSEAAPALERAVTLAPKSAHGYLPLAVARARLGDRPGALRALSQLLAADPAPKEVQRAAQVAARLHDPARALPQRLVKDFETALAWAERDDTAQLALDQAEILIEQAPDQSLLHALAGLCHARLDDAGRAVEAFRRAIELAPDAPQPRLFLADLYDRKGKRELAARHYEETIARDPFDARARERLGAYALERGDGAAAVTQLQVLAWLHPEASGTRIALARALVATGALEAAEAELLAAIEAAPEELEGQMALGQLLLARRAKTKSASERDELGGRAAKAFEQVLDAQPANAAAARALAEARRN